MKRLTLVLALSAITVPFFAASPGTAAGDSRNLLLGSLIPDEGYCDQPYIVITKDGNWLCMLTTGPGKEGNKGQHVVATTSRDRGKTWSKLVDIEPSSGPEASWVVPLVTPSGRIYAFYDYNGDDVTSMPARQEAVPAKPQVKKNGKPRPLRADMLGWYCFKYSDDNGQTWSKERYRLPVRETACDRTNQWQGKVQIFWGIDKPKTDGGAAFFAFTKLGRYMLEEGEGFLFRSNNILSEPDPRKLHWAMLPEGERGIYAPQFGSVQEEHNLVPLGGGRLYCVYRTTTGSPCQAYSNDGGRTWSTPEHMTYTPGGRKVKTPRACPKLWRTADGRYLFWFHNHGRLDFKGRNPAWLLGGVEREGRLYWSQPEIVLYDPGGSNGMSYPDLVEQDGRTWVTETQKTDARVHEIDRRLLEGLWRQATLREVARDGLVLDWQPGASQKRELSRPIDLTKASGVTLECWLRLDTFAPGQPLVLHRGSNGSGLTLSTAADGAVRLELSDGRNKAAWDSDPGGLQAGKLHHVVAIVDAGPKIISFVVDGLFHDGGTARPQGWGRWKDPLGEVAAAGPVTVGPGVRHVRIYDRYLRTAEAIGNYHAGK